MEMTTFDKNMAAASFAEAGDHKSARETLADDKACNKGKEAPEAAPSRPYGKSLLFGAISLSAYVLIFHNETWVMDNFTKGGIYTLFPVLTAFFFSFVHGPFGSNLLSALGLEARKQ